MKAKVKFKIQELAVIYGALNEVANGAGSNFESMTEQELFLKTVQRVNSRFITPARIKEVISSVNAGA